MTMLGLRAINKKLKSSLPFFGILALGGCALSPFDEDGLFRKASTVVGVTAPLAEPKDFVKDTRKESDYVPVGVTPPKRSVELQKGQGVKDFEEGLLTRRLQSLQQAATPVPKSPYDGKIEPGFKVPPPPPLPEGKAPEIGLRGANPSPIAATPAAQSAVPLQKQPADTKTSAKKPIEKKDRSGLTQTDH